MCVCVYLVSHSDSKWANKISINIKIYIYIDRSSNHPHSSTPSAPFSTLNTVSHRYNYIVLLIHSLSFRSVVVVVFFLCFITPPHIFPSGEFYCTLAAERTRMPIKLFFHCLNAGVQRALLRLSLIMLTLSTSMYTYIHTYISISGYRRIYILLLSLLCCLGSTDWPANCEEGTRSGLDSIRRGPRMEESVIEKWLDMKLIYWAIDTV